MQRHQRGGAARGGAKQVWWAWRKALLWIATDLWRVFGGLEKGAAYLHNHSFWMKMALLGIILLLEI